MSLVDASIGLLKSIHIQVQYEGLVLLIIGYAILLELMKMPHLQDPIIKNLISILKVTVADVEESNDGKHVYFIK